jgi:hypothetical protein
VSNRVLLELIGVAFITHETSILIKKSMDSKTSTILGAIQCGQDKNLFKIRLNDMSVIRG